MLSLIKAKRGQLGLDNAKAFVYGILFLALISFVVVVVIGQLNSSSILTANSLEKNQTTLIFNNVTTGVSSLFANTSTWFVVLGLAITIAILAVIVYYAVNGFRGMGSTRGL